MARNPPLHFIHSFLKRLKQFKPEFGREERYVEDLSHESQAGMKQSRATRTKFSSRRQQD